MSLHNKELGGKREVRKKKRNEDGRDERKEGRKGEGRSPEAWSWTLGENLCFFLIGECVVGGLWGCVRW